MATQRTHRIVIGSVVGLFAVLTAIILLLPRPVYHPLSPDDAFLKLAHQPVQFSYAVGHTDASLLAAAHAICAAEAAGQTSPTLPPGFSEYQILLSPQGGLSMITTGDATDNAAVKAGELVTDAEFTICPRPSLTP